MATEQHTQSFDLDRARELVNELGDQMSRDYAAASALTDQLAKEEVGSVSHRLAEALEERLSAGELLNALRRLFCVEQPVHHG